MDCGDDIHWTVDLASSSPSVGRYLHSPEDIGDEDDNAELG